MFQQATNAAVTPDNLAPSVLSEDDVGGLMVTVPGGHQIWTKRYGSHPTVMIVCGGGPGFDHRLTLPFVSELNAANVSVILYDQLGTDASDHPLPYTDPANYSVEAFAQHVEAIRQAHKIEKWYVLGHSFGATVAMEYAVQSKGAHLQGLVLSNMAMSYQLLNSFKQALIPTWPSEVQEIVIRCTKNKQFDDPQYVAVMSQYFRDAFFTRVPFQPSSLAALTEGNEECMNGMCGEPDRLHTTGVVGKWDRMADLPNVTVPTLIIGGRFDFVPESHHHDVAKALPHGEVYICDNGSHMAWLDDPRNYYDHLTAWLKRVAAQ